jgi:hypothetical protein
VRVLSVGQFCRPPNIRGSPWRHEPDRTPRSIVSSRIASRFTGERPIRDLGLLSDWLPECLRGHGSHWDPI